MQLKNASVLSFTVSGTPADANLLLLPYFHYEFVTQRCYCSLWSFGAAHESQ